MRTTPACLKPRRAFVIGGILAANIFGRVNPGAAQYVLKGREPDFLGFSSSKPKNPPNREEALSTTKYSLKGKPKAQAPEKVMRPKKTKIKSEPVVKQAMVDKEKTGEVYDAEARRRERKARAVKQNKEFSTPIVASIAGLGVPVAAVYLADDFRGIFFAEDEETSSSLSASSPAKSQWRSLGARRTDVSTAASASSANVLVEEQEEEEEEEEEKE